MKSAVKIEHGPDGWGGPFELCETDTQHVVASITGGGIHPLAEKIAALLGVEAIDGFKNKVEPEEMIVAVVDCGGTARCGIYPKLGVKTIDILGISPSGPLAKYIKKDNFCSGVTVENISLLNKVGRKAEKKNETPEEPKNLKTVSESMAEQNGFVGMINRMGRSIGSVVNTFYQAARETLDLVLKNIIPFMMFISVVVGFINYTGIGNMIANAIKPMAGSLPGLVCLSVICGLPFLSPVLGPGAVIAQVIGVLIGNEIGKGNIPPSYALPALFAIDTQVGCDFIPVALTLAEADEETISLGVPAILFSHQITGPVTVVIAYIFSLGLF